LAYNSLSPYSVAPLGYSSNIAAPLAYSSNIAAAPLGYSAAAPLAYGYNGYNGSPILRSGFRNVIY
jgi:hypothetical protein